MGAETTKTLVREQANFEEFRGLTSHMQHASVRASVLSAIFMPTVMLLGSVGTAIVIGKGGAMTAAGVFGLGTLAAFISYTSQLFDPIQSIARILAEFQTANAAAERVLQLIDTPCDIVDTPEVVRQFGDNFYPREENWPSIAKSLESMQQALETYCK